MKNLKIGVRLVLSFILVTILASIAGGVGLGVSLNIDRQYSKAMVINGFTQGDIGRFNTYLNRNAALVRDMIFLTDEADLQSTQKEIDDLSQKVNSTLVIVKENCQTPEELKQIAIIEENLPKYQEKRNIIIQMGLELRNDEALAYFQKEAKPLLDACINAADALADLNVTMGTEVSTDLTQQSHMSSILIVVTIAISVVISILIGIQIARSISRPIQEIETAAKEMAEGKLKADISYQSKDELGNLSDSMRTMIHRISSYMDSITDITKQLADGNLIVAQQEDFLGDFRPVQLSLRNLIQSLNSTLGQINQAADQVSAGSDQVSSGAQALSQGATEQASSVEELAATINDISTQVQDTAQNALAAREETSHASQSVTTCNQQMQEMIAAMDDISHKSTEIGKIIKTIEDIAFQTNILALNAAVEAARAGVAGKGFAVVADEVRNLASKSAEASKNTSTLIEGSIVAVEKGTRIANDTAESLSQVVQSTTVTAGTVDKIADAANQQALSITQVTEGIDQISNVVQTNSATAEESAAASEELSGQAQLLKSLVDQFKLQQQENDTWQAPPSASRMDTMAANLYGGKY